MWDRKEVKKEGKKHLIKNYWAFVVVCFLLAFLGCEYNTSTAVIHNYDNKQTVTENVLHSPEHLTTIKILGGEENIITNIAESFSNFHSFILKLIGSFKEMFNNQYHEALILAFIVIIQILYVLLICNPLIVGSRRFFIDNHYNDKTKIGKILTPFKNKYFLNTCKIMFLQTIYLILWIFTIIGIFIKYYEYRMIPYILADNPDMKSKEVFALTKKMMKGSKIKLFIFDLSYSGWFILTLLTFGLVGILYSNPYKSAATAEIYLKLKETGN